MVFGQCQRIALVTNHRGNACEGALVRKGNDTAGWTAGNAGHPVYENARPVSIFCKRSVACLAGNSAGTRIQILDPLKAFNAIFCPGEGRAAKVIIFKPCTLRKCRQGGEQSFTLKQFIKSASYRTLVDGRFLQARLMLWEVGMLFAEELISKLQSRGLFPRETSSVIRVSLTKSRQVPTNILHDLFLAIHFEDSYRGFQRVRYSTRSAGS